ncbi:hypothetical protein [Acinetobacter pseudolwoffii]|uniref:hypothetical protein n=1 Tax=Acinetobacter pseudolwoffii TaxID=2053287 RepID=UPI002578E9A7|nr:hypothetical protein [Acinetobacter pseudolwoffii]MDM1340224.1 hypothetical protein [Acinetobacter pseudolwoffii]
MLKQPEVTNKLIEVEYAVTYPLNTTTISYDSNGNVKSRFSDMVWDFSSQISQINRRKTVNFNFIKNNDKELQDKLVFEAKLISYGLLYAYTGSGANKINQLVDDYGRIRFVIEVASSINTTLSTISFNNELFKKIIDGVAEKSRQQIKLMLSFFKKISSFSNIYISHNFTLSASQFNQLNKLLNSRPVEVSNQHLVIPTRIYSNIYNQSEIILDEYLLHCKEIEAFAKKRSKYIEEVNGRIYYRSQNLKYNHKNEVKKFGLLANKYNILTKIDVLHYLNLISDIALSRILMFTGMRAGEALNAPENCLIELNKNKKNIYILNSYTNKETNNGPMKATWITSDAVKKAIDVLKSINKITGYDSAFKRVMGSEFPLFLGRGDKLNSALYNFPLKARVRLDEAFVYFNFDFIVNENDLDELKLTATESELEYYNVQLGCNFPINNHQFRRTLTVYAARSTLVQTPALKAQLKHLTRDMTYYYGNQSEFAPNFIAEDTLVQAYQNELHKYNNECFLEDVINATEPLFGASGIRLQNLKNDPIVPIFLTDSKSALKDIKNGKLFYKRTAIGGCNRNGICDKISPLSITACISCKDAIFSEKSVKALTTAKNNFYKQIKLFDEDSHFALQLRSEIESIDKILEKRNIFCEANNA